MKAKTIKRVLRKTVDAWIDSIDDPAIAEIARKNTIVTGGAIASMLLREPVNDYDIYFRTHSAAMAVAEYYAAQNDSIEVQSDDNNRISLFIRSEGVVGDLRDDEEEPEAIENQEYRITFVSSNAISLTDRIQLVFRFHGEPDQIHENYDFVHCTNYWCSWNGELVLNPKALESLLSRELRYVGSLYPLCSIIRTRKFISRQWTINAGQYLRMAMQLNELDLTDIKVLEDQLVGVDSLYFMQLIRALQEKDPEKVSTPYLMELVDRIF